MTSRDEHRQVLLIGGSSSVGKTTVARTLAQQLLWEHVETDLLLNSQPGLQPFQNEPDIWDRPIEALRDMMIQAAVASAPYLEKLLNHSAPSAVVEGERIPPEFAQRLLRRHNFASVFVIEEDPERLYGTLMARSRSFSLLPESQRRKVAEVNSSYCRWLNERCLDLGLSSVPAFPWNTLASRILHLSKLCPSNRPDSTSTSSRIA